MPEYTPSQRQAIEHGGHDVLVSASAGSGKTTVLVERILHRLRQGQQLSRMLIVTFTNAATADMKLKIQKKLKEAIDAEKDPAIHRHLVTQLAISNGAPIMTLDAFSNQIVQQYYYAIELDPGFRLLSDPIERTILEEEVWGDVCEVLYASDEQAAFTALADNFSQGQDDSGLMTTVFKLIDFANTTTNPVQWLADLATPYAPETFDQDYATRYWPTIAAQCREAAAELEALLPDLDPDDKAHLKGIENLNQTIEALKVLAASAPADYQAAYEALAAFKWGSWPSGKAASDAAQAAKDHTKAARNAIKDRFTKDVADALTIAPDDLKHALEHAYPLMQTLSTAAQEFFHAFAATKQERHLQDFTDIAHNALAILQSIDPHTGKPIADNFKTSFDQVFVDEYQDINPLQEALLDEVSQLTPGNRFMVGDIKQSIYGFRLADPRLFLAKYHRFGDADTPGERLVLAKNFRSTSNVIDFTNLIFSQLMDEQVGDMDYDQDAQLQRGTFDAPADFAPTTELLVNVDESATEDADATEQAEIDKATRQVQRVIAKIQALVNDPKAVLYEGFDKKTQTWRTRRIAYRDITLLVRSRTQNVTIQSAFAAANVPIVVADAQNYFKTTELMTMLSLLRLIDNPHQEIPLVAALRSPLVGMSADQLALIRLAKPEASFDDAWEAFLAAPAASTWRQKTQAKAKRFQQQLADLRDFAKEHELVELIWRCYDEFGYLDYVGGLPGGNQRQANLRALAGRAANYENGGFRGLFAFIHFIELMQKQDKDLDTAVTVDPDVDAVSLMTIHASKGLEFPVMFLLSAEKQFNLRDLSATSVLTPELAGIQWTDPESSVRYLLPQYLQAKTQKRSQLLAEEMRLLYVALTRAKQYLYIVGTVKDKEAALKPWQSATSAGSQILPAQLRAKGKSYLDWLLMALLRTPALDGDGLPETFNAQAKIEFATPTEVATTSQPAKVETTTMPALDLDLTTWFDWQYPHAAATKTTGFQSVTEIKRALSEDPTNAELVKSGRQLAGNRFVSDFATPKFLARPQGVSATAIGTATHRVLQILDWHQPAANAVPDAIGQLVATDQVDADVAAGINQTNLVAFCQSEFGQLIAAHADSLQREVAFSLLLPASDVFATMAGDASSDIMVHGIIDGFIDTPDGIVVFDYKTDRVANADALLPRYTTQLQLYAKALALMQPRPVVGRYLVSLVHGSTVAVAKGAQE
ncbi:helicase-exonuclease AddAB subunit AddA [Lacticaseibacillus sp. GG6-2]